MTDEETTPSAPNDIYAVPEGHKAGFVAVVGRPNVGKSTLMNTLLQEKVAIVTPRPQTTRTRQLGIITTEQMQMIFVDTPGIMEPRHKLDEYMVETATESITDADVVLCLMDGSTPPGPGDERIAAQLKALPETIPVVLGINKSDMLKPAEVLPRTQAYRDLLPQAEWILLSAQEGSGCDELLAMLATLLPEGPRYYPPDLVTDAYLRDLAAELIREQIMLQLREEVPYGTAVQIDEYKEREKGTTYISANIFVERDNHKRIIIGAKGQQLRAIGVAARQEIETMVEGKVFLDLWVKVVPKWRRDEKALRRLGYSSGE